MSSLRGLLRREVFGHMLQPLRHYAGRVKHVFFHRAGEKDHPKGPGVSGRPDFPYLILLGSLLSFSAGWVNAFTYLAANAGVSHVTGSVTRAGMDLSSHDVEGLSRCVGLWLSFFIGGVFSGIFIINESFAMGRAYGHAFLVVSVFLFWASMWAAYFPHNPHWIFVAATACGIQNGVTTRYSGNVVRTTHMTGLTTDVGIVVGHMLRCHPKAETWKLKLYLPMLGCFFLGAALCREAYTRYQHRAMIFPTLFVFCLGLSYIGMLSKVRQQPFHKVLFRRVSEEVLTPHSPTSIRAKVMRQASQLAVERQQQKEKEARHAIDQQQSFIEDLERGGGMASPAPSSESAQGGSDVAGQRPGEEVEEIIEPPPKVAVVSPPAPPV